MTERPGGTVTFLFTDIEGSTMLVKLLGDRYGDVLSEHQRILREAFAARGGEEVDTQGDAFFFVFTRARDAAEAAAAGQRALAAHDWPDGVAVRVRIGMHTGEPNVSKEGRYHGLGVHRTARIMAAGHGGQILASRATASVLADDEPRGLHLRDLGEHRLKDLDRPERIYQVDVDGLPHQFRPLRTADFWTRRRLVGTGVGVVVAIVAAALAVFTLGGSAPVLSSVEANALGVIDPGTGTITGEVKLGATPTHIAVGESAVWVTNADGNTVSRVDPRTRALVETIPVGSSPGGVTTGHGAVWVTNSLDGTVSRIDPKTNTVVQRPIPVGNNPGGIVSAGHWIWVANTGDGTITRIDPVTGRATTPLKVTATELAVGAGTVWASDRVGNRVVRLDPSSGQVVQTIIVGNGPTGIAFGNGAAWVTNSLDGTVSRIDASTNSVAASVATGNGPTAVAVGGGDVWVSNQFDGTLARIDPGSNRVAQRIRVGNRPQGVALLGNTVLVGVRQSDAGHRGGTLVVRMNRDVDSIDSAVAYDSTSWSILRMTGDGLVAFNQTGGLGGAQPVPDLAVSLPSPTAGGTTYTFRLRPGIRYSTGAPVVPSDVRATLERDFQLGLPVPAYYDDIVGGAGCESHPNDCDLTSGIAADDSAGTVAFHLVAPDPEFLYKLALPFAYVVPAHTPPREAGRQGLPALPATGPYMIQSYRPNHELRLVRNPRFHEWSKAAQPNGYPDRIDFQVGGSSDDAVNAVIDGEADAFSTSQSETPPSAALLDTIEIQNASQVHVNPQPSTIALFLNTRLPPFDNLDARQAVNYAADRAAAVRDAGGGEVAEATCQILPPHFPGYQPYCPYTVAPSTRGAWRAPDLAKARALVAASGTRGMKVTVWSWGELPRFGPFAVRLLDSLGYRATMKVRGGFGYFGVVGDSRTRAQAGTFEWISDYPAASGFFIPILTCHSFLPRDPANSNDSQFCDRGIDRQIGQALIAQATDPDAARGLWEGVDRQTVDRSPLVSLVTTKVVDVLSPRVGNYQYSPPLGMLIDQLWVH